MSNSRTRIQYHGMDITLDVYDKIIDVCRLIAKAEGLPFDAAHERFAVSATYDALHRPETLLWAESAEFVADEYYLNH